MTFVDNKQVLMYGVPLRSKYPDSEMLFQKQKISRDAQNMMPKIITYRSIPKKKICTSSSSLLIRSRKFLMTSRIKKIRLPKKNIRSRDFKSRLREDADQWHWGFIWVDRPTRLRNTWLGFLAFVMILFLDRSERHFLYDIMSGSLKISFSNGCCYIRCRFR